MLAQNVGYFAVGRHFGFVPFFFPGVVAVALFLWTRRDRRSWQWLTLGIAAFTAVGLAAYMPYSWSGGGGPPGNRYFLSIYPVLLFLTPPLTSFTPAVAAFAGGTAFIAHVLINPFSAAKEPYLIAERGLLRALPVELTMINDLPVSLDRRRSRITYESEPELMLYLLDHNVHPSSLTEFWVNARRRGDVILRSPQRLEAVTVTITSPIPNRATVSVGVDSATLVLRPRVPAGGDAGAVGGLFAAAVGVRPVGRDHVRVHPDAGTARVGGRAVPGRPGATDPARQRRGRLPDWALRVSRLTRAQPDRRFPEPV